MAELKQKIDKKKNYTVKELGPRIYSTAGIFHGGGKIRNTESQNVIIPTVFLKRILDLREDYIKMDLIKLSTYKLSKNKLKTIKNDKNKINNIYKVKDNNEWFFVSFMDIINFEPQEDKVEREICLYIDNNIKIKSKASSRADFIKEIYENFEHKTVKDIFSESRYFDHYLEDRKKMDLIDVDKLFQEFASEYFGYNVKTDIFSQAYIYTISKFASGAGQKGGEFFTPDKICKMVVDCMQLELKDKGRTSIFDVASGSGTFLVEAANYLKKNNPNVDVNDKLEFYLQEKEGQTLILGEAGLLLSGLQHINAYHGNTLLEYYKGITDQEAKIGQHRRKMDYGLGNPPYGDKILKKEDYELIKKQIGKQSRWDDYELPPRGELEWFFVQTSLDMIHDKGKLGLVLPLGTMFKKNSRKIMIEEDIVEGIIQLPENMFATTGIPTCIWIFNKNKEEKDKNKIFMINSSKDYVKVDKYNEVDFEKVVDTYVNRKEVEGYSSYIEFDEIKEKEFNVSTHRYVFEDEPEEVIDIKKLSEDLYSINKDITIKTNSLNNIWKDILKLNNIELDKK